MDTLAHFLWTVILFRKVKHYVWALLFGVLPDLLSFGISIMSRLLFTGFSFGRPEVHQIPKWVMMLYGITHSLIIPIIILLIIYIIYKKVPLFLLAWPIHIILDIPTHTKEFLPTPFLWPISNYAFPGISWGTRWFMLTNYSLIIIGLIYVFRKELTAGIKKIFTP